MRGDDPRRECRRVERHFAARSICQWSSRGAYAIAGLHLPRVGRRDDDRDPEGGVRPRQRGLARSLLQERVRAEHHQQRPRLQVPGLRAARQRRGERGGPRRERAEQQFLLAREFRGRRAGERRRRRSLAAAEAEGGECLLYCFAVLFFRNAILS